MPITCDLSNIEPGQAVQRYVSNTNLLPVYVYLARVYNTVLANPIGKNLYHCNLQHCAKKLAIGKAIIGLYRALVDLKPIKIPHPSLYLLFLLF